MGKGYTSARSLTLINVYMFASAVNANFRDPFFGQKVAAMRNTIAFKIDVTVRNTINLLKHV